LSPALQSNSGESPGRGVVVVSIAVIVVIWALNFIAAKIGLRHLSALAMASFRVVMAGAVMVPINLFYRRLPSFAEAAEAQRRGFSKLDYWRFAYLGFFGVAVNQTCFTMALRYTSIAHASVLIALGPVYILILAVLMRLERWTWHKAGGTCVALAGIAVLTAQGGISAHSPTLRGDLIAVCGSVGFALYAVLGKRVAGKYDALTMTAYTHFAGALIVLPAAIYAGVKIGRADQWRAIPWESWLAMAYMAVFASAVAYVLYYWLLRYLPASQVSAFTYLLPVTAMILGIVWLGEPARVTQFFGAALVMAGVYWIESGRAADRREQSAGGAAPSPPPATLD
jgi:drug/metabolite transporter (DMT)-like permease